MSDQAKIGDAIVIAYMEGEEAMPEAVGDGFAVSSTEDGGMQLALHWNDMVDGTRRTVLIQGGMLRFFDSLGAGLHRVVKAARKRKVTQERGELTRDRSSVS
jgi:hypothetical protein